MSNQRTTLGDALAALAHDAALAQDKLDHATQQSQARYEAFVREVAKGAGTVDPALAEILLDLAPRRLCVRGFDVECRVRVGLQRSVHVSLEARPLNLAYQRMYQSSRSTDDVIRIEVEQVPAGPQRFPQSNKD
ncbi:hypothetical protein [Polyangium sp. y55x31]|uniref:hypothetical protein n=1 Tax=Polyangium sp. y55x31 TaxID=3042688 RepID=UPI00248308C5|nr:hypothetical protein [Polyangium sp. y55x31]MDI1478902.1 hypothetical protein [Polyangium sp. y55x31]